MRAPATVRSVQVITAGQPLGREHRVAVVRGAVAAAMLVTAGLVVGWLAVGTPFIEQFMPGLRPTPTQTAIGVFAWSFALLVPVGFLLLGAARAVTAVDHALALRPGAHTPRLARALPDDYIVATHLRLPDGRRVAELVLGPFGVAVLGDVPPPSVTRHAGQGWEVRAGRGRWTPIESPLDRTTRDMERVKRWLGGEHRDFVVRVHAAIVTPDTTVERTTTCAVIAPDQVPGWLAALPPQRGLTAQRREQLADEIRAVASRH